MPGHLWLIGGRKRVKTAALRTHGSTKVCMVQQMQGQLMHHERPLTEEPSWASRDGLGCQGMAKWMTVTNRHCCIRRQNPMYCAGEMAGNWGSMGMVAKAGPKSNGNLAWFWTISSVMIRNIHFRRMSVVSRLKTGKNWIKGSLRKRWWGCFMSRWVEWVSG